MTDTFELLILFIILGIIISNCSNLNLELNQSFMNWNYQLLEQFSYLTASSLPIANIVQIKLSAFLPVFLVTLK